MSAIEIRPINLDKSAERDAFIRFAWDIYKDDKYWVAPLWMDMRARLNRKHPFFEFGDMQLFMAYRDGKPVGRIAAVQNRRYNEVHQCKTGFFGFFECINDQAVANLLFDTAKKWVQERGLNIIHGPASPSSNYDYGLLVDGFDDEPRVLMTYNPQYYVALVENYGFKKTMGLFAYKLAKDNVLKNEKFLRVKDLARERSKVRIRQINMKNLKSEVPLIKKIYNTAWENNYGFTPMSDKELDAMVAELKMIAEPKLIHFVESEQGEVLGLALALPDYNYILKQMNGSLFPFNFLKMFTQKKNIKWMRVVLLGLLPEARNKGIDAILYHELIKNGMELGYEFAEASWILEHNPGMNRGLQVVNGEVYKTYNVYELAI